MTMARRLRTKDLSAGYDSRVILKDISLEVPAGRITAIVGGNASGKSTLLRTLARILKPKGGSVLLDDNVIHDMPSNAVARIMGLLPQSPSRPKVLPSPTWWDAVDILITGCSHVGMPRTTAP